MNGAWSAAFVALCVLVVLIGVVVLGTLRRVTLLLEAAEVTLSAAASASLGGLSVGSRVPSFTAESVEGQIVTEADLEHRLTAVLFLSRSCDACQTLANDLAQGQAPADLGVRLIVVSDDAATATEFANSTQATVLVDRDREVAEAFDARVVPRAFMVGEERLVMASGRPNDWESLQRLIATAEGGDRVAELTAAPTAP